MTRTLLLALTLMLCPLAADAYLIEVGGVPYTVEIQTGTYVEVFGDTENPWNPADETELAGNALAAVLTATGFTGPDYILVPGVIVQGYNAGGDVFGAQLSAPHSDNNVTDVWVVSNLFGVPINPAIYPYRDAWAVATAVPAPSTGWLLACGLAVAAGMARGWRRT